MPRTSEQSGIVLILALLIITAALTATAVSFPDPESGMTLRYALSDFLTR